MNLLFGGSIQNTNKSGTGIRKPTQSRLSTTYQSFARAQNFDESPAQLKEFLTLTLSQVTSSEASRKVAIKYLATENGLTRVRRIVETKFSTRYSVTTPMFDPHCLLFLRLITQKNVLQSLAVEKDVGTIYNVIYGLNGNRAVLFFQNMVSCLQGTEQKSDNTDQGGASSRLEPLLLISAAFLHVLTVNQSASIRTEFKELAKSLGAYFDVSEEIKTVGPADTKFYQVHENLRKIADILALGDSIAIAKPCTVAADLRSQQQDCFPVDFPGDLSEFGPRHDNDHTQIEDIRILPTISEIYSQRKDFLPTRDAYTLPSGHHQEGIFRLLDSQFRLLREDTSGLLRDAIRLIVEHWNTIVHDTNWGAKRKLLRQNSPTPMRIYYDAQLREFHASDIKGIEVKVEFNQLYKLRRLSPLKRKKHWIDSRALREGGGLLALVDAEVDNGINVVFLQVSKRDIDPVQGNNNPGNVCDLVSNGERAMITLRFPSMPTKHDLPSLISMKSHQSERPLILVEFVAVQYNQFEGVLRCLQGLHKSPSRIPFTNWLTAGERNSLTSTDYASGTNFVPTPRYLRGSPLDLSSIGDDGNLDGSTVPLTLSVQDDPQYMCRKLCEISSLDAGQAEAMVSALTHEVALIQGPPGTGKSYVGIQIAKCLLKNKERLNLGPLLCVYVVVSQYVLQVNGITHLY